METYNASEVRDALLQGTTVMAIELWPSWAPSLDDPEKSKWWGQDRSHRRPGTERRAGLFTRLITVVIPIMTPGLIATGVLLVILSWNEFIYALLFIQTPSKFTLPTYIATLITEDETFWGRLAAIGFLSSLPILALVGVVQKGLTRGFAGGLK